MPDDVEISGSDLDEWFAALERGDFAARYDQRLAEERERCRQYGDALLAPPLDASED